jgi:hypothetical protein
MPKICQVEACSRPVFGGGYCKYHQYHRRKEGQKNPKTTRERLDKKYFELRKKFLDTNKRCMINSPECTQEATCVHHTRGRGIYMLMVETWMPSCKRCNNYVEAHDEWARENGYKKSRYAAPIRNHQLPPDNE